MQTNKIIAVLGSNGFVGYRLVEWLYLNEKANVRPIVRSYNSMAKVSKFNLNVAIADALDYDSLLEATKGVDILIHSIVGDGNTIVKSIKNAYEVCLENDIKRLVYISTAVVYGNTPKPGTVEGSDYIKGSTSEYISAKIKAEKLLSQMNSNNQLQVIILRPGIVFGPGSTHWTNQIALNLIQQEAFLVDGGNGTCNTIYIDNLVFAIWLACITNEDKSDDFIVTDCEKVTWRDLYAQVASFREIDINSITSVSLFDAEEFLEHCLVADQAGQKLRRLKRWLLPTVYGIIVRLLPGFFKRIVKRIIRINDVIGESNERTYSLDREIVELQLCEWQFSSKKAKTQLNYEPIYNFKTASEKTVSWLKFVYGSGGSLQ